MTWNTYYDAIQDMLLVNLPMNTTTAGMGETISSTLKRTANGSPAKTPGERKLAIKTAAMQLQTAVDDFEATLGGENTRRGPNAAGERDLLLAISYDRSDEDTYIHTDVPIPPSPLTVLVGCMVYLISLQMKKGRHPEKVLRGSLSTYGPDCVPSFPGSMSFK